MQRKTSEAATAERGTADRILEDLSNVGDGPMPIEDRLLALAQLRETGGIPHTQVDRFCLEKIGRLRTGLFAAREEHEKMKALVEGMLAPPYFPAVFVSAGGTPQGIGALIQTATEIRVVGISDDVPVSELTAGDPVLISHERNVLVRKADCRTFLTGDVATYSRSTPDGRLVLRSREEEIVVLATSELRAAAPRPGDAVRFTRDLGLAFEKIEQSKGDEYFLEDTPSDSFDEIGGLEREIDLLKSALSLHTFHQGITSKYKLRRKKAVLMEGPPGNGKTKVARAACAWLATLSKSGRARFINVKPGALSSMWYGQTQLHYREIFRVAREAAAQDPGSVICMFWDEIDAIGGARGESVHRIDDNVLNAFMAELNGLEERGNVIVLAATNRLDALDPALVRPGRLGDLVLHFPSPNRRAARSILARHLPADIPYSSSHSSAHSSSHSSSEADAGESRELLLDTAVERIFAQTGDTELANLTFRDGKRRLVRAADLVSGAHLEAIAQAAVERACLRETEGGPAGVASADMHAAVAAFFASAPRALTPRSARGYLRDLPQDVDVVRVDMIARKVRNPGLYRAEVA